MTNGLDSFMHSFGRGVAYSHIPMVSEIRSVHWSIWISLAFCLKAARSVERKWIVDEITDYTGSPAVTNSALRSGSISGLETSSSSSCTTRIPVAARHYFSRASGCFTLSSAARSWKSVTYLFASMAASWLSETGEHSVQSEYCFLDCGEPCEQLLHTRVWLHRLRHGLWRSR